MNKSESQKSEQRKYAYFPGCSLHGMALDYAESARAVTDSLGIELIEIPDWTCCGSTPAHLTDDLLAVSLPVKNILRAREISDQIAQPPQKNAIYDKNNEIPKTTYYQRIILPFGNVLFGVGKKKF